MIHHPSHPPLRRGKLFLIRHPRLAGFFINNFTFPIFLLTDGNVAGCGYHFGSADNDNPLAFLSSQKRRGSAEGLSKQAFVIPLTASVPVALSFLPTEENNLHSVTAYLSE